MGNFNYLGMLFKGVEREGGFLFQVSKDSELLIVDLNENWQIDIHVRLVYLIYAF